MKARRAEQDHRERVARVVAAIVASPMSAHRLEDLARMAHFSPFHFHRIYSAIAGETVTTTIRRVRLALATRLLESGDGSITQVALAAPPGGPEGRIGLAGRLLRRPGPDGGFQLLRLRRLGGALACRGGD
jgi:AraC family transcriptional regulator